LSIKNHSWAVLRRAVVRQGSTYLGAVMIALVWFVLFVYVSVERDHAQRAAVQNTTNLARVLEEHLSRSLKHVDGALLLLRASYERHPDGFDISNWVHITELLGDPAMQLVIVGADGTVKMRSVGPVWPSINVSDRDHFRALASSQTDELVISKPVIGRSTKKLSVHLARRLRARDGSFDGIITATLDPSYFAKFYGSVDIGKEGYVRVLGLDGIVRAVDGRITGTIGQNLLQAEIFKQ
jgi:two-component system, sensor histidine kinase